MPRKPRLDAPGLLYHVMARGINREKIFYDDFDRFAFLDRLGKVAKESGTPIYAFALIPNHFHLLLRRVGSPISSVMRRLLTGYAVTFNKRHKRSGYLFQNRYKATICEQEQYLLELIRYINLNPLRSSVVSSLAELDSFAFASHSFMIGKNKVEWFKKDIVLGEFATTERKAKSRYKNFMADGLSMGKRPELTGGGLKRSLGYPRNYPKIKQEFDDRVLGGGEFVRELIAIANVEAKPIEEQPSKEDILSEVIKHFSVSKSEIIGANKSRQATKARALYSYRLAKELGLGASIIANELGVTSSAVVK